MDGAVDGAVRQLTGRLPANHVPANAGPQTAGKVVARKLQLYDLARQRTGADNCVCRDVARHSPWHEERAAASRPSRYEIVAQGLFLGLTSLIAG